MLKFVSYSLVAQVAAAALALVSGAVVNHSLGPSGRGDYAELIAWVLILSTVLGWSFNNVVYHFANRQLYELPRPLLAGTAVVVWLASTAILAAVILLAFTFAPAIASQNLRESAGLVVLLSSLMLGVGLLDPLLKVAQRFRALAVASVVVGAASLVAIGILAGLNLLTVSRLLLVTGAGQLVLAGAYVVALSRNEEQWLPPKVEWKTVRQILLSGLQVHAATVSGLLYVRVDQIFVYQLAGAQETGVYAVAVAVAMQLLMLPNVVAQVLSSRLVEAGVGEDAEISLRTTRLTLFSIGLGLLVLVVLAGPIIAVYAGPGYADAVPLLRLLTVGILFFSIPHLLSPYWLKQGRFVLASTTAVGLLALNLGLNVLWIPAHGATGAAWATDATYGVGMVISLVVFALLSRRNPLAIFTLPAEDRVFVWRLLRTGSRVQRVMP